MQAVDVEGNIHEVDESEIQWRPSVYGLVVRDGKILVLPANFNGEKFALPGGGVELGERFESALVREVKEETGINVKPGRFISAADNIFVWEPANPSKRQVFHALLCYYECQYIDGELSVDNFDEAEKDYAGLARWIPIEDALTMPVASSYDFRPVIASLVKGL